MLCKSTVHSNTPSRMGQVWSVNSFKGSSFRKVACHCTNTVFLYSWFSSTEVQSWIINVVATHWRKGDNIFKIKSSPWHRKKTERLSRQVPRAAASWYFRGGNDGKQLNMVLKILWDNFPVSSPLAVGLQVPQEKLTIKHMAMNETAI